MAQVLTVIPQEQARVLGQSAGADPSIISCLVQPLSFQRDLTRTLLDAPNELELTADDFKTITFVTEPVTEAVREAKRANPARFRPEQPILASRTSPSSIMERLIPWSDYTLADLDQLFYLMPGAAPADHFSYADLAGTNPQWIKYIQMRTGEWGRGYSLGMSWLPAEQSGINYDYLLLPQQTATGARIVPGPAKLDSTSTAHYIQWVLRQQERGVKLVIADTTSVPGATSSGENEIALALLQRCLLALRITTVSGNLVLAVDEGLMQSASPLILGLLTIMASAYADLYLLYPMSCQLAGASSSGRPSQCLYLICLGRRQDLLPTYSGAQVLDSWITALAGKTETILNYPMVAGIPSKINLWLQQAMSPAPRLDKASMHLAKAPLLWNVGTPRPVDLS